MIKTAILATAVSAAGTVAPSPAQAVTPAPQLKEEDVSQAAEDLAKGVQNMTKTEQEMGKEFFTTTLKYAKLAVLQGQYRDYRFIKHLSKRINKELHYRGPKKGCKIGKFSHCVAQATKNMDPTNEHMWEESFDLSRAVEKFPDCTKTAGCESVFSTLTPAQQKDLGTQAQKSDLLLQGIINDGTKQAESLWRKYESFERNFTNKWMPREEKEVMKIADQVAKDLKCDEKCIDDKIKKAVPLKESYTTCGCALPKDMYFSADEVLQMMSEHNMDVMAGVEENEQELVAEPTSDSGATWGWYAFGALATANAAYVATKKN